MSAERLELADEVAPAQADTESFALREQVSQRLAAHRSRKNRTTADPVPQTASAHPARAILAARVAERYAHSQSYRAFLAEEAERAIRQAEAAAEIARRNADAVAAAQYNLLQELDEQLAHDEAEATSAHAPHHKTRAHHSSSHSQQEPGSHFEGVIQSSERPAVPASTQSQSLFPSALTRGELTVRLPEDLRHATLNSLTTNTTPNPLDFLLPDADEALSLDEEIAFRRAPVFDPIEPTVEIPANLIEFPRQLVAPRRARPRLAEGPLREDSSTPNDPTQLRIFEVESEQLSTAPSVEDTPAPEWGSILLDAQPRAAEANTHPPHYEDVSFRADPERLRARNATRGGVEGVVEAPPHFLQDANAPAATSLAQHRSPTIEKRNLYAAPLDVAPLELRIMSAAVDTIAVLAAFLIFAAVAVGTAASFSPGGLHLPLTTAAAAAFVAIALLGIGYQYFFFTFGDSTPGMRYARISLCTFSDENPSREAMRGRILALALSSATLGLGLLWTFLDEDRLGWHDRISHMYQRTY